MDAEVKPPCPICAGTGACMTCFDDPVPGLDCVCESTHKCVDCLGFGTHTAYAVIQMDRLRTVLRRSGIAI